MCNKSSPTRILLWATSSTGTADGIHHLHAVEHLREVCMWLISGRSVHSHIDVHHLVGWGHHNPCSFVPLDKLRDHCQLALLSLRN